MIAVAPTSSELTARTWVRSVRVRIRCSYRPFVHRALWVLDPNHPIVGQRFGLYRVPHVCASDTTRNAHAGANRRLGRFLSAPGQHLRATPGGAGHPRAEV